MPYFTVMGPRPLSGGGGFTPSNLTLKFLYEADNAGVSTSGGNVTSVADMTANGNNLEVFGTVPYTASGINGHPAFDFVAANNGGLQTIRDAGPDLGNGSNNMAWFFVVATMESPTVNFGRLLSYYGDAGSGNADFNNDSSASILSRSGTSDSWQTYRNSVSLDAAISLNTAYLMVVVWDGTDEIQYLNNVEVGRTACNKNWGDGHNQICIGNMANIDGVGSNGTGGLGGTNSPYDGKVSLVGGSTGVPSSGDRSNLYAYAQSKYGVA